MKPILNFTLRQSDHTALHENSVVNASKYLEKSFEDFVEGRIEITEDDMKNVKTSCTVSQKTADRLKAKAGEMNLPVSKLARLIAEKVLKTHH